MDKSTSFMGKYLVAFNLSLLTQSRKVFHKAHQE